MMRKALILAISALAASASRAQLAPPSLSNTVTYSDWTSASAICSLPIQPPNYSTTTQTTTNSDPVALSGVSGSASSTVTYLGAAIQIVTTGCPNIMSGSTASVRSQTNDILTFLGGTGSGGGTVVMSFGNSQVASSVTNYNYLSDGYYEMNAEMDAGPGSGNNLFNSGYSVSVVEGSMSSSQGCSSGGCSFNAATNQYLVPFSFPYGVPLHFGFNEDGAGAGNGYLVNFTGAVSFIIPCGTTITAASGVNYPVQYSPTGACSTNSGGSGAAADAPIPPWALGMLAATLVGITLRRPRKPARDSHL